MVVDVTHVAVAHWNESCNGGGERVAWELGRQFDAPVWVGRRSPDIEPPDVTVRELHDGLLGRLVDRGGISEMVAQQIGWEIAAPLREADVLITSGNEPLAYVPPAGQTWIHYVHHTSRQATDLLPQVHRDPTGLVERATNGIERVVRKIERQAYCSYARKPTLLVANSEVVARRIRRYWGVERDRIRVVHPPVPVHEYSPAAAPTGDYYLALSRLDWHKRLGEVVDAFAGTDHELRIAGDGIKRDALEEQAAGHDNIDLLGYVSEQRKRELFAGARAVINNALAEDFGLTTVEPLAAGTPVLGVREGMTQHLVHDGLTGYSFERGDLAAAVDRFEREGGVWSPQRLAAFARQFRPERFGDEMRDLVAEARAQRRVDVDLDVPSPGFEPADPTSAATDGGDQP